jgi:hypothetical protein
MANPSEWAVSFARLAAGLPAAIETGEVMGALLAPGQKSGPSKLAAVREGVAAAAGLGDLAGPGGASAGGPAEAVITALINAVVAFRAMYKAAEPAAPPPAPSIGAAGTAQTGEPGA